MDLSSVGGYEILQAFILQDVAKGSSKLDRPDFGLTTGTIYAALASQGENVRRRTEDAIVAKFGFSNIIVDGVTIVADPSMPAGDLFLINTNGMGIQVLRTPGIREVQNNDGLQRVPISIRPFMNAYNSLHRASVMHVTLALVTSSLQRQGIATDVT